MGNEAGNGLVELLVVVIVGAKAHHRNAPLMAHRALSIGMLGPLIRRPSGRGSTSDGGGGRCCGRCCGSGSGHGRGALLILMVRGDDGEYIFRRGLLSALGLSRT